MVKKISHFSINIRIVSLLLIIIILFFILYCRLFYIQIIDSSVLIEKAQSQWLRDLPMIADRGEIVDVNGITIASSNTTYAIYARPNELSNIEDLAYKLSNILGIEYTKLKDKLSKKGVSEITIDKNLNKDKMLEILKLDLKGIYFSSNTKRYYPYGKFLTQVLGIVSSDNNGQSGLELQYDNYLKGINGAALSETDLIGRKLNNSTVNYILPTSGMKTKLTIDYYMQAFVEKAVNDSMAKYDALSCSCIIMDTSCGAVLAMASTPTYDLNEIPRDDINKLNIGSKNILLTDVYEPGSTFKILTSAIGLEEDKIKESYYCPGYHMVDGQRIKCWRSIGHGSQDFQEGIKNSCNCVFMDIALSVGKEKMYEYFSKFGITQKTGVDLPGEASSLMLKIDNVKNVDIARIGFGQAIAVTPLQLITAVSSVINGGKLYTPYIVDSIYSQNEILAYKHNSDYKNVISKETSDTLKEYLYSVVEEGGGKNAKVDGYKIGGKTGTAQKYENGVIARGKYISSFIGYTNIDNRDIACLMIVNEPKGYAYYGSIVAAPYVGEIFKNIYQYKDIKPIDYNKEEIEFPNLMDLSIIDALALLKELNIEYELDGESGKIVYQIPAAGSIVDKDVVAYVCAK